MQIASKENNYHYNKLLKGKANQLRKNATMAEACLWKYVLKAGLLKGYKFYIVDFMSMELMLVIEVDGLSHTYETAFAYDTFRQKNLEAVGFTVIRFSDDEVLTAIDRVRGKLEEWVEKYAESPPPNPRQRGK